MPRRHPSFCDEILGLFPEENVGLFAVLLTCDALRTAVASCAEMESHGRTAAPQRTRTGRSRAVYMHEAQGSLPYT